MLIVIALDAKCRDALDTDIAPDLFVVFLDGPCATAFDNKLNIIHVRIAMSSDGVLHIDNLGADLYGDALITKIRSNEVVEAD